MNQCSTGYHLEGELDSAEGAKALEGLAVTFSDGLPPNTRIGAPAELEETELDEEGNAVKAKKKAKSKASPAPKFELSTPVSTAAATDGSSPNTLTTPDEVTGPGTIEKSPEQIEAGIFNIDGIQDAR